LCVHLAVCMGPVPIPPGVGTCAHTAAVRQREGVSPLVHASGSLHGAGSHPSGGRHLRAHCGREAEARGLSSCSCIWQSAWGRSRSFVISEFRRVASPLRVQPYNAYIAIQKMLPWNPKKDCRHCVRPPITAPFREEEKEEEDDEEDRQDFLNPRCIIYCIPGKMCKLCFPSMFVLAITESRTTS